jgi:hypothetical protein
MEAVYEGSLLGHGVSTEYMDKHGFEYSFSVMSHAHEQSDCLDRRVLGFVAHHVEAG